MAMHQSTREHPALKSPSAASFPDAASPPVRAQLLPRPCRQILIGCALTVAAATAMTSAFELKSLPTVSAPDFVWLAFYLFRTQDAVWLAALAALWLGLAFTPMLPLSARARAFASRRPAAIPTGLALLVLVMGIAGVTIVFQGYHLSRDEFLADFDAIVFRSGHVIASVDPQWRPFVFALEPRYMLPVTGDVGSISTYLPINAVLHTAMGLIANPDWTGAVLAAAAVVATWGVARRLWPQRPDAAVVCSILVATSSQVLVTAMTSYAMTAHLALNMIWLWFFLRGDKVGHGAAIATGWLASGLHQLVFHPIFVAPFIMGLWATGRRALACLYIGSYAAIGLFWIEYWHIVFGQEGIATHIGDNTGPLYFVVRILAQVESFQWSGIDLMVKNALRFVIWQNPALLPLACLAYMTIRRGSGIASELFTGILLTLVAMFLLSSYQGHGWGYRYLHGLIGSAALLGGYGWLALTTPLTQDETRRSQTIMVICSAIAVLILLPVHAMQAHDFASPYVRASKAISQAPTDVVIVDKSRLLFAEDLVRNDPFLRNRPKVLDLTNLTEANIRDLCAHHRVAIFDREQGLAFGIVPNDDATAYDDDVRATARQMMVRYGCGIDKVGLVQSRP